MTQDIKSTVMEEHEFEIEKTPCFMNFWLFWNIKNARHGNEGMVFGTKLLDKQNPFDCDLQSVGEVKPLVTDKDDF